MIRGEREREKEVIRGEGDGEVLFEEGEQEAEADDHLEDKGKADH